MPLRYKIDIISALKDSGLTTYAIRKQKVFSEGTLTAFRNRKPVGWDVIENICRITGLQPGDILEYATDNESQTDGLSTS